MDKPTNLLHKCHHLRVSANHGIRISSIAVPKVLFPVSDPLIEEKNSEWNCATYYIVCILNNARSLCTSQ